MRAPTGWLNSYFRKSLGTKAMADALEAGGIEVEQIIYATQLDDKIVIADVKKVAQHPNADKLRLATIYDGTSEVTVVCGAPNLKIGMKTAYAKIGAKLPDGTVIQLAKLRGVESVGMLCSPRELGLSEDHAGIIELDGGAIPGQKISELFGHEDVIDVTTQANRFDLLSMLGLAREVSAQTGAELEMPKLAQFIQSKPAPEVQIEAKSAIRRYMLVGISVNHGHKPAESLKQRLEAAGQRSISPVVDITNYTMLETGQPLHSFDAAKVKLPIVVRFAKPKELIVTLDNVERQLSDQDLVIADQQGAIAIAGVMGGARTEVSDATKEILLESASFDATMVRKTAKRHNLRSEASARFERSLPANLAEVGLTRALQLYQTELAGEQITTVSDALYEPGELTKIVVEPEHISKVLSIPVSAKDLSRVLPKLGFEVVEETAALAVTVPWWRPDVMLAEDLAEEYIRLVGYDKVPARLPKWQPKALKPDSYWSSLWRAKATLKGLGLFEVITYSFVSKQQLEQFGYKLADHLKLKNPMSQEQAYLRQNLLPSLMTALLRNQGYAIEFGLYEVSQVFVPTKPGQQPKEPKQLAVLYKHPTSAYPIAKAALDQLQASFNTNLRLAIEDQPEFLPSRSAVIKDGTKVIGRIGEIHPRYLTGLRNKANIGYLEIDLEALFAASRAISYQPISRFPSIYRDVSVLVNRDVVWQEVSQVILETELAHPSFLRDYYGSEIDPSKKSLSIRLEISSLDATLTDKEADKRLAQITSLLGRRFGATLRS